MPYRFCLVFLSIANSFAYTQATREILGHEGPVTSVSYSPDGSRIASSSFDKTVRLWNPADGASLGVFNVHTEAVLSVAWDQTGRRLLSGGRDRQAILWNLTAGDAIRRSSPLAADIVKILPSLDGKAIVTLTADGVVRFLDSMSLQQTSEWKLGDRPPITATLSSDASLLFTSHEDRSVRSWKLPTGELLALDVSAEAPTTHFVCTTDNAWLLTGDAQGNVRGYKQPLGLASPLASVSGDIVNILRAGNLAVSLTSENAAHVHDLTTGALVRSIPLPAPVRDAVLTATDPPTLIALGEDRSLRAWNLTDGSSLGVRSDLPEESRSLAMLPDHSRIFFGTSTGNIRSIPYPFSIEFDERAIAAHDGPLNALSRSTDGSLILTASQDKTVHLWSAEGSPVRAFALFAPVRHAALAPGGDKLAAVGTDSSARVWSVNGTELKVLGGVAGPIEFSADGKWIAWTTADNKVLVGPADFSAEPKALLAHASPIRTIAFSAQSHQLFASADDGNVKLADLVTGMELKTLACHQGPVRAIALSADAKTLVTGGEDKTLKTWNVETGALVLTFADASAPITSLNTTADASQIYAGSTDNVVRCYRHGKLVGSTPCPSPTGLLVSGDGKTCIASTGDNHLRFFTERTPVLLGQHAGAVNGLAITNDGKTLYSAGDDGLVKLWDLASGKSPRALAHGSPAQKVVVSPDGSRLVSTEASGKLRIWDTVQADPIALVDAGAPITSITLSPDATRCLIATSDSTQIVAMDGHLLERSRAPGILAAAFNIDLRSLVVGGKGAWLAIKPPAPSWQIAVPGAVQSMVKAPDGKVLVASADNQLLTITPADGAIVGTWTTPAPLRVTFVDAARVAVTSNDQKLRLLDAATGNLLQEYTSTDAFRDLAYNPDGGFLVSTHAAGSINFWSLPASAEQPGKLIGSSPVPPGSNLAVMASPGAPSTLVSEKNTLAVYGVPLPASKSLLAHDGQVFSTAWNGDGTRAATGGSDEAVILWNVNEATAIATLRGHVGQVYTTDFHPQKPWLASAGADKSIILWDLESGKEIRRWTAGDGPIYQIAFFSNGTKILAAGVDKKVRLFDVETGNLDKIFDGFSEEIYGLALRPDDKRVVAAGYGGTITVWDIESANPTFTQKLPAPAYSVSLRADGAQLAVGTADNKIILIDIPENAR